MTERAKTTRCRQVDPGWLHISSNSIRLKIGKTVDPKRRMRAARTWLPEFIIHAGADDPLRIQYIVPANAPIVTYVPGDKNDIKPGAKVFIVAVKQADGMLQGRAWRVGRDGLTPPM